MKAKSELFEKFKEFKALIENLSDKKIKILRSDNGGEYTSKEFDAFCKDVGIKREITTPYNPQQNGVAERKNRTIMEAVKTMIYDQDIPMHLWEEAEITEKNVMMTSSSHFQVFLVFGLAGSIKSMQCG